MLEHHLPAENHVAHPVDGGGHLLRTELTDILMSPGTEVAAAILVQAKIELGSMLYDSSVE